jgi:hypothetical protein
VSDTSPAPPQQPQASERGPPSTWSRFASAAFLSAIACHSTTEAASVSDSSPAPPQQPQASERGPPSTWSRFASAVVFSAIAWHKGMFDGAWGMAVCSTISCHAQLS